MEQLHLTLTAARVDQKNFTLWLNSWQTGQVLRVLVADKTPGGELVLQVGGRQITTRADIPIQKGAALLLEVVSLHPIPNLKVIRAQLPAIGPATLAADPLSSQLQVLMPRQGAILSPLQTLFSSATNVNILSVLGLNPTVLGHFAKSIGGLKSLSEPRYLRQALQRSGLFLESQLLRGRSAPQQGDLKAMLLRLLERANRALSQAGKAGPDKVSLSNFQGELEGALATLTLNQLATCQVADNGSSVWLVELPYTLQGALHSMSLKIQRDGAASRQAQEQDWRVLLSTSLPQLGQVEAELFLRGNKVSVVIYSAQGDTAEIMKHQLDQLKEGLQSRGLEVSVLLSHLGARGERATNSLDNQYVDEKA